MKKLFTLLFAFCGCQLSYAADRYVDPSLSVGNGTTLFNTITSAINASINGDRIIVYAGTYNEPTLNINKSIKILPQVSGSLINFYANINITGFPGMKLEISGFNLGTYSISGNSITGGIASNRAKVSLIACKMDNITFNQNFYELNCLRCSVTNTTTFKFGNFVISRTANLYVADEPALNNGDRIRIICDTISSTFEYRNDDCEVLIANNLLQDLYMFKWNYNSAKTNKIINNEFGANNYFFIPVYGVPGYNFNVSSNKFNGSTYFYNSSSTCYNSTCNYGSTLSATCTPGFYDGSASAPNCGNNIGWSTTSSIFPNISIAGFFYWTYNGVDLPCAVPTGSNPLIFSKVVGAAGTNNTGNPNHEFYDIDLSINDRGRTGGPYSINNYNPISNPNNGKAFIFDLDIPADLFPGQQVDIKARGYHGN